jgi:HEAT repeat protein
MASDPTQNDRSSRVTVIVMMVVMIGGAIVLTYFMHVRSAELVRNLDAADPDKVSDSLVLLKDRRDPDGIGKATRLLSSDNHDVWINAALYVGAMEKEISVPYLIKALRSADDRQADEIQSDLRSITGESLGGANAGRKWWLAKNPGSSFNFDNHASTRG